MRKGIQVIMGLLLAAAPGWGQYPNVRVSSPLVTDPNEVTITIDPQNPLRLAAGANLRYTYRSSDGGLTWAEGTLASSLGVWGDPCVVYDMAGMLHYGHLSFPRMQAGDWLDRIVVQRSSDGGATWSDGAGIGLDPPRDQDKEWISVDRSPASPFFNTLAMAWTEFDAYGSADPRDSSRILFSRSTDGGTTWSSPLRVNERSGNCLDADSTVEGAVPAAGPDGTLYLSWSGPLGIMLDRSTDGGAHWGTDIHVTAQPGGWDFMVPGLDRCNGMPITACDISPSPHRGNLYICWSDQRNGTDNTDVFFITSTDGGTSWGPAVKVNTDGTRTHQFLPWMTVDPVTGVVYVVFYDRRASTGEATDVFLARSTDGGASFADERISASPFTPDSSVFFGDYIGIAALAGNAYPVWMRMDQRLMSVWIARVRDTMTVAVGEKPDARPIRLALDQNFPNPFNPSTLIRFSLDRPCAHISLDVCDLLGREVALLLDGSAVAGTHTVRFDGAHLASGVYLVRLSASVSGQGRAAMLVRRMVLIR